MELMTIREVSHMLGVGRTLVQRLVTEGQIPSYQIGRIRRIPVDGVLTYLDTVAHTNASDAAKEMECTSTK